jgi:hypothetical protein
MVKLQLRTTISSTTDPEEPAATSTAWIGADNIANSYFTASSTGCSKNFTNGVVTCQIPNTATSTLGDSQADQWLQYRVTLESAGDLTPTLTEINLQYVVNSAPQFQNIAVAQSTTTGQFMISYEVRDIDTDSGGNQGELFMTLEYCTTDCSATSSLWSTASSSLILDEASSTLATTTVADGLTASTTTWTSHTMIWDVKADYSGAYNPGFRVRLVANDNQLANNLGYGVSTTTIIDTTNPVKGTIIVDASVEPAALTLNASDNSHFMMKVSSSSELFSTTSDLFKSPDWQEYVDTTTISIEASTTHIYALYRDDYNNYATTTITVPLTGLVVSIIVVVETP